MRGTGDLRRRIQYSVLTEDAVREKQARVTGMNRSTAPMVQVQTTESGGFIHDATGPHDRRRQSQS